MRYRSRRGFYSGAERRNSKASVVSVAGYGCSILVDGSAVGDRRSPIEVDDKAVGGGEDCGCGAEKFEGVGGDTGPLIHKEDVCSVFVCRKEARIDGIGATRLQQDKKIFRREAANATVKKVGLQDRCATGTFQRRRLERGKSTMQSVLEASEVCNRNLLTCIDIKTHMHTFPLIRDLFLPKSCRAIYTSINSMDDNILCDKSANSFALYYAGVREPPKEKIRARKINYARRYVLVKLLHGKAEPLEIKPACPSKEVAGSSEIEVIHKKDAPNYRTRSRKGIPYRSPLF
uniref:Uncharacterized protein n=1 Tax=Ananas comosus var. bracteatus TaxID=296719 RepID=A0A6V7Q4Y6_ANACO|nr:unnamed protein product [Ananas comosus var. bracteatus]